MKSARGWSPAGKAGLAWGARAGCQGGRRPAPGRRGGGNMREWAVGGSGDVVGGGGRPTEASGRSGGCAPECGSPMAETHKDEGPM